MIMDKNKNLTDKELLAMGKKAPPAKKRTLFKEYAVTFVNLGLTSKDSKMMRKELPAIAKRGAGLVMENILLKTKMPTKLPEYQQPFITIIIYAGIVDKVGGKETFIYPSEPADMHIEEVAV